MLTTDVAGWLYRRPQQTSRVAQIQREPCHTKSSATVRLFQTPTAAAAKPRQLQYTAAGNGLQPLFCPHWHAPHL